SGHGWPTGRGPAASLLGAVDAVGGNQDAEHHALVAFGHPLGSSGRAPVFAIGACVESVAVPAAAGWHGGHGSRPAPWELRGGRGRGATAWPGYSPDDSLRTGKRRMVTACDRVLSSGSRSTLASPGEE